MLVGSRTLFKSLSQRFYSSNPQKNHYDIVVVGGGMIGTTLACTLGKNPKLSNKSILLLEGGKQVKWEVSANYSNRVFSLSPSTITLLKKIGAWAHISRFGDIKRMQVWDALSDARITFDNGEKDQSIAYVVENDVLLSAVQKQIDEVKSVEILYQTQLGNCIEEKDNVVEITLENGSKFSCELLLGCDGFNSAVRKTAGFHHISHNYHHLGIVATLNIPQDCENVTAWQRHLPNGEFIALLPLAEGLSSLVWSTNQQEAKRLLQLSQEDFIDAINDAYVKVYPRSNFIDRSSAMLDDFIRYFNPSSSRSVFQLPPKIVGFDVKSRAAFPLGLGHATNYVKKGIALVGDAAHRTHPLAGQGVNLGFGDIVSLNQVLGRAVDAGSVLGNINYLKEYETERQRYNVSMLLTVHSIFNLYSTNFTPIVLLRSLGLQATDALTPIKKFLISQASGLRN